MQRRHCSSCNALYWSVQGVFDRTYQECIAGLSMRCTCSKIDLYEVWHHHALNKEISYSCSIRQQSYYREACLSLLHIFRFSNCHSLCYNMHIYVNKDFNPDHQSTLVVLWSRVISGITFSPFQKMSVIIL